MRLSNRSGTKRPEPNSKQRSQTLRKRRRRLFMESLEDRRLLTTVTLSNGSDAFVDASSANRSVTFNTGHFPAGSTITDVNARLQFTKTDGTCTSQQSGAAFHNEIVYRLTSPAGTTRSLVNAGSYSGGADIGVVTVTFDDAASTPVSGTPVSGTFDPVQSLSAFNGQAALGTWTLFVQDTVGADPLCHYDFRLTVSADAPNLPPTANANGPYTVAEGSSTMLSSAGSTDSDGSINLYQWDLDNNGSFETSGASPSFSAAGIDGLTSRTVRLRVRDNDGAFSPIDTAVVNIANVPPTINSVTNTGPVNEGSSVSVSVSATDPIDSLLYQFDFDNDGSYEVGPQASSSASHVFTDDGTYPVNVRVTDGDGGVDTGSTVVTVNNAAPQNLVVAATPTINENEVAVVTGSFVDPGVEDAHKITVDWDDPNNGTDSFFDLPATNTLAVNNTFTSSDGAVLTITAVNTSTGAISFRVDDHQYLDDGDATLGNGTPSDLSNVVVTVEEVTSVLFAITQADVVAEQLPYGPTVIDESDSAFVSTVNAAAVHDSWKQIATSDGSTELFTIDWQFSSSKTLSQRFTDAVNVGESVTWTVTSASFGTQVYNGTWRFSDNAGDMAARFAGTNPDLFFSNDDGIWGGGFGVINGDSPGPQSNIVWGHGNYNGGDASDELYQNGVLSSPPSGFKNFMYLDGGGSGSAVSASATVEVLNVAPSNLVLSLADNDIDENGSTLLSGTFDDPGTLDEHTVQIDWGDGSAVQTVQLAAGVTSFSGISHTYQDDGDSPGNGTAFDVSSISVTVMDDDDGDSGIGAGGRLFAVDGAADTPSTLYELDPATGAIINIIGATGFDHITDIDFDPTTGILYGVTSDGRTSNGELLTIDTTTGIATSIGTHNSRLPDISFDSNGTLYAWNEFDESTSGVFDDLGTINLTTGVYTNIGSPLGTARTGLAFDSIDQLFMKSGNVLHTLNPATGGSTGSVSVSGATLRNIAEFSPGDVLYTANRDGSGSNPGTTATLYTLDTTTGVATAIGSNSIGYLSGLAFGGAGGVIDITVKNVAPTVALNAVSMINENGTATLSGSYTDPGTLDEHDVTVDWDDANNATDSTFAVSAIANLSIGDTFNSTTDSAVLTVTGLTADTVSFSVQHQYLDDGPAPGNNTADDTSTISVTVDDDDTGTGSSTETVLVKNVAPTVALNAVSMINENGTATLSGSYTDPGTLDEHDVTVDWDDANNATDSTFAVSAIASLSIGDTFNSTTDSAVLTVTGLTSDTVNFSVQHQYLDDGPAPGNNTADDTSTIIVTVDDDDAGNGSSTETVLVKNVAPEITSFVTDSAGCGGAAEHEPVTATLEFTDSGTLDVHTVVIDWGDGTIETLTVPVGDRLFEPTHSYTTGGVFDVSISIADDDEPSVLPVASASVVITGVGVVGDTLYIVGTDEDDHVSVNQTGKGVYKVHADFLANPDEPRNVDPADYTNGISDIVMILCDGDDHGTISGGIDLPTLIDGGEGDDHLNGGNGLNFIYGAAGDDHINGGGLNDILIGGGDEDRLIGNPGQDFMYGGDSELLTAPADASLSAHHDAMLELLSEWDSDPEGDAADELTSVLVDDGAEDKLTGSSAEDTVILDPEDIWTDAKSNGKGKGKGK